MTFQAPPPDQIRSDGEGAAYPYYIQWHAQGSAKHGLQPASFSLRATGAGTVPQATTAMVNGTVWDIYNIETGWQLWPDNGQKEYRANPTTSHPLPYPGAGWSECVRIPMALDNDTIACWDQATTGTWKGFMQVAAIIAQQHPANPGLYPLIRVTGAVLVATGQNSTSVPQLEIVQWVQQPACMIPQAQPVAPAPVQQQAPPPPVQQPQQPPQAAPAPAWGPPQPQQVSSAPLAPAAPPAGAWTT